MEANQTDEQKACGNCQFFLADEGSQDWGICQLKEIWPATPQLTKTGMHACYQAFQNSSWQPITFGKFSTKIARTKTGLYISISLTALFLLLGIVCLLVPPFEIVGLLCMLPLFLIGIIAIIFFWRAH